MIKLTKTPLTLLRTLLIVLSVLTVSGLFELAPSVGAAQLTDTYIRLNTMKTGVSTSFRLVFKTNASAGQTSMTINFNGLDSTTWTGSSGAVNATQTLSGTSCATDIPGDSNLAGGSLAATGSGSTITVSNMTALSASTTYCEDFTSSTAVTNPTAGEYHPVITLGGGDINTVAVRIISNDAVTVNATVPPTFNFVLSSNTDNFSSNLSTSSVVDSTGVTATINTNAKTGWFAWAKDSNTGLNSSTQSKTIASVSPGNGSVQTLTAGTEGYLTGITAITQGTGAGTVSATAGYDGTGGAGKGDGLDTTFRQIASSTGTAAGAVLTIKERAAIAGTTPASSDYTDTLTLLAAGNF